MTRKLLLLILLAGLFLPIRAHAQDASSYSAVFVQLWPEFDRPSMLVMYQITPSPQLELPAEIRVLIPAVAGKPNAVATCEGDQPCNNTPYTQNQPSGDWSELVIPITLPIDVRVEYYDPRLSKDGSNRSFRFIWPGDTTVDNITVQVQQPLRAADMRIRPGTVQTSTGQDGMNYYNLSIGAVPAGQPVELTIEYTKDNDELSNTSLPVAPSEPLANTSNPLQLSQKTITALLALLGALLIVGGTAWYWISGRQPAAAASRRRVRRRSSEGGGAPAEPASGAAVYCHQCGNRASPGDVFCRTCGTPLRKS